MDVDVAERLLLDEKYTEAELRLLKPLTVNLG